MSHWQEHVRYEGVAAGRPAGHARSGWAVPYGDLAALERDLERRRLERRADGTVAPGSASAGIRELCHDLRQPLATARALLHRIQAQAGAAAQPHGVSDQLQGVAGQLDAVHQLLEAQLRPPASVPVDLGLLAAGIAEPLAARHGALASVEVTGSPVVLGDPVLLGRMVANLLENACQAVLPGGVLRLRASSYDGVVTLDVEDDGSATGREGGTGLGLLIVQSALDRHGGTAVTGPSELGGLSVRLRLPALTGPTTTAGEPLL